MPDQRSIPVTVPDSAWQAQPPTPEGEPRPRYAVWQLEALRGDAWVAVNPGHFEENAGGDYLATARFADGDERIRLRWIKGGGTLALVDIALDGAPSGASTYGGR